MILGTAQHTVSQLWERARCTHFLRRSPQGNAHHGPIKIIGSAEQDRNALGPRPTRKAREAALWHVPSQSRGSRTGLLARPTHPSAGRSIQASWVCKARPPPDPSTGRFSTQGRQRRGLQGQHAGMPGPGWLSEPAIWLCVLDPGRWPRRTLGLSLCLQTPYRPFFKVFPNSLWRRSGPLRRALGPKPGGDIWGLLAEAAASEDQSPSPGTRLCAR